MATKFTINGIATGQTIEASQVSQSVQAFTAADAYDIQVSGSVLLTGSFIQQSGSAENVTRIQLKQVADSTASAAAPYTLPGSFGFVAIDSDGYLYSASAAAGSQGATGAQGTNGAQGDSGTQGAQGNTGGTGTQGATGADGGDGTQGGTGAQGTAGSGGSQGETGPIGPQGQTGTNGTNGSQGATGINGPQGADGEKGATGDVGTQGESGNTGAQGNTGPAGPQGATGAGTQGATGTQGNTGTQGADGDTGSQGATGAGTQGATGAQGADGTNGTNGTQGETGTQGTTGAQGTDGTNGPQGATGTDGTQGETGAKGDEGSGGGAGNVYNPQVRYLVDSSGTDYELYATSTTNLFVASWSRTGTTLTITHASHGLGNGDKVIVRNANEDYLIGTVANSAANTFDVTCNNTGGTSGTEAAYGSLFTATVTNSSGDVTAIVMTAPGGISGSSQLNNIQLFANNQENTMTITVPSGLQEGAGGYTDKQSINQVVAVANNFDGTGTSGALTPSISYNLGANFNRFTVAGIDNFTPIALNVRF